MGFLFPFRFQKKTEEASKDLTPQASEGHITRRIELSELVAQIIDDAKDQLTTEATPGPDEKREEVITMPVAKERRVRYTGNFSFEVLAATPEEAAEKLAKIREHATVTNIRSINVKEPKSE